jgi:transposase
MGTRGRPKLKITISPECLRTISEMLSQQAPNEIQRAKLRAIEIAATGNCSYEQIGKHLRFSKSSIQNWIQRWHKANGDLSKYLHVGRGRHSLLRKRFEKLCIAYQNGEFKTPDEAVRWYERRYRIRKSPQNMDYWLDEIRVFYERKRVGKKT